jgi:hypothetical protein
MIRAHLRRYGALDRTLTLGEPKPEARRANPEILASASEPERVRLALPAIGRRLAAEPFSSL